jgi:hypothetical protein
MWICEVCGHEWSAMMSDSEVPEHCECGGKTKMSENTEEPR